MSSAPLRVRFAPSPTGALHIGGARTALYNWLAARGGGGTLVLRIEDTDRERSTPANTDQILEALRWLELDWDEGPVSQHERAARHRDRVEELVRSERAYPDPATGDEVRAWKQEHGGTGYRGQAREQAGAAIRLRVPDDGETVVEDVIRGQVRFENRLQDDLVIARGDGSAVYNFAVAVDDTDMRITDVIRGDDHLSNTPKQLLVMDALGVEPPRYAHLPLLHGPDGRKLSKRHGAASVQELRDSGYLPVAVRNYLALLGWGTEDDTTLMTTAELVERFRVERVGRSAAVFDERKLRWMNGRFMRELELTEYERRFDGFLRQTDAEAALAFGEGDAERRRLACELAREKAQTLADAWPLIRFLFEPPVDDPKAWAKVMTPEARPLLQAARDALAEQGDWSPSGLETALAQVVERETVKPGRLYQPIRVAVTGSTVSPGIFDTLAALGRAETLARLESALARMD